MKTSYLIPIFCFFFNLNPFLSSAQIHWHTIGKEHGDARDSVRRFGNRDTLVINFDSVYVLNQTQVRYYDLLMKLKLSVTKDNKQLEKLFTELVNNTTRNLAELENLSKQMKENADSTSSVGIKLAGKTLDSVDKTNTLLTTSKVLLDSANARLTRADLHLAKAEELIGKAQKKQWLERLKWGGGGVLVGILVRSFLFKR